MDPGGHHVWAGAEEAALKEPSAVLQTLAHMPLPQGARAGWAWVGPESQKPLSGPLCGPGRDHPALGSSAHPLLQEGLN